MKIEIKNDKLSTESTDRDSSFAGSSVKKKIVNNGKIKPQLINSKTNLGGNSQKNNSNANDKESKQEKDQFLGILDATLTDQNIQKEVCDLGDFGDDTMINTPQNKTYVTLTRILYSNDCMKFYIVMISISLLILLYSVIGYFFHVGMVILI